LGNNIKTGGNGMRILWAALFVGLCATAANAAELTVLAPGFVKNAGIDDLAAAYAKQTGIKVTVNSVGMGAMMNTIATGTPAADVVMLPQNLMDQLQGQGGVVAGSRQSLGRVQIVMIVPAGAAHPDISTTAKLAAALHAARHVAYSSPWKDEKSAQAMIIHDILQRPEYAGTHEVLVINGNGVTGIKQGAEMALQLECETRDPAVSVVGPLPSELHAWLDGDVAVSSRSPDAKAAAAFVAYITRPAAAAIWKAKGLERQ
jgi:molybdate transport system substrate-binding protein